LSYKRSTPPFETVVRSPQPLVAVNGFTARSVMVLGKSRGYAARASTLHVLAQMIEWSHRCVCDSPTQPKEPAQRVASANTAWTSGLQLILATEAATRP